ncbi:MAG: hypothetical protein IJZ68_05565 [Bacteroidaceae bacterium]|nr:hypothetical protein [Bacteroidaceae bacterium]
MRQVKVIATDELLPHEIEEAVNEVMQELDANGRHVTKTKYCINKDGDLNMVIIEHDEK